MDNDNLEHWETGMTSSEHCILICNLVVRATMITMKKDNIRNNYFVKTGYLMTIDKTDDELIKPQALTKRVIIDDRCLSEQDKINYCMGNGVKGGTNANY